MIRTLYPTCVQPQKNLLEILKKSFGRKSTWTGDWLFLQDKNEQTKSLKTRSQYTLECYRFEFSWRSNHFRLRKSESSGQKISISAWTKPAKCRVDYSLSVLNSLRVIFCHTSTPFGSRNFWKNHKFTRMHWNFRNQNLILRSQSSEKLKERQVVILENGLTFERFGIRYHWCRYELGLLNTPGSRMNWTEQIFLVDRLRMFVEL